MPKARICAGWIPLALFGLLANSNPACGAPAVATEGIVVEKVEKASPAETAGIRAGDALVRWWRPGESQPRSEAERGSLATPFDWGEVELEQAPRGEIVLSVDRDGSSSDLRLRLTEGSLVTRPRLVGKDLVDWEAGAALLAAAGKAPEEAEASRAEGAALWEGVCARAMERSERRTAWWIRLRLADRLAGALENERAHRVAGQVIEEASREGDLVVAAVGFGDEGRRYRRENDLPRAEAALRRALAIREEMGPESLAVAATLTNLGNILRNRGELEAAQECYGRSLVIRKTSAPGSLAEAISLNNLGIVAYERGDLVKAQELYGEAFEIRERLLPQSLAVSASHVNLGNVAYARGDFQKASESWKRALEIMRALSSETLDTAGTLNNLGLVALALDDLDAAEEYFARSTALQERLAPQSMAVAMTLHNLGGVAEARGAWGQAADHYRRSLDITVRLAPESLSQALVLTKLGEVARERGEAEKASDYLLKALALQEKLAPEGLDAATTLSDLGTVAKDRGDFDRAEAYLQKSLAIRTRLAPGSELVAVSLRDLANVRLGRNDPEGTFSYLSKAVTALESQRGRLGGGRQASERFSAKHADTYRELVSVGLRLNRKEEAFGAMEKFRARNLLEMLAERDLVFSRDVPEGLEQERRAADREYDRIQGQLAEVNPEKDPPQVEELLSALRKCGDRQRDIAERIKKASPRLASLQYPESLDSEAAKRIFGPGELYLSYCVGAGETHLFALLDGRLEVFTLPIRRETLARKVRFFRALMGDPTAPRQALCAIARDLYATLVGPASAMVKDARSLVVSPDSLLHVLPFAALMPGPETYLIEERPISYAVSATVLGQLGRPSERAPAEATLAAFGDPSRAGWEPTYRGRPLAPLPETRGEVEAISSMFGGHSRTYLGAAATEEEAKRLGLNTTLVHFACHGICDVRFPLDSCLVLTPTAGKEGGGDGENGFLQAWEILEKVRVDADLVTLSACETALGREMGGEGLVGLTRAFQYAGARTVLASLWTVGDAGSAELMRSFYRRLKGGTVKAEALRSAQIAMIRSGGNGKARKTADWSHPVHWAAFVLHGEAE